MRQSDKQFIFLKNMLKYLEYAIEKYPDLKITEGDGARPLILQFIYYSGYYLDDNQIKQSNKMKRSRTMNSGHLIRMAHDFNYYWKNIYLDPEKESEWSPEAVLCMNDLKQYWKKLNKKNVHGGDWILYHNDKREHVRDWPHIEMKND